MTMRRFSAIAAAGAMIALAGCATPYDQNYPRGPAPVSGSYPAYPASPQQDIVRYGYVESIESVASERSTAPGVGAIGGAIAGGVLGHQVGSGRGNTAATIGGAVLGGVVGHQVEQQVRGRQAAAAEYRFRVRMDDGSYQTFNRPTHDNIRVGDRVRVEGGNLYAS